jgi:predicted transposase/invertase (TIGR01784 family)
MPEDEPLHQPNDKLFKQAFADPATAAGFLEAYLPAALAAAVDWSSLRLEPGSFGDSQFRRHESDLLFSAPVPP